jgi:radical SAM protein with 4Fe4S-binding SPASM domain
MKFTNTSLLSRNKNVIHRDIGKTRYILHPISGEILEFNSTAQFIWEALDRQGNLDGIASEISTRFNLKREYATEILLKFLPDLYEAGLIKVEGEGHQAEKIPGGNAVHRSKNVAELWHAAKNCIVPLKIDLELTYDCNLSCKYCYNKTPGIGKTLTLEQISQLICKIRSLGCIFLTLTGGEPLIRKDIPEIIAHAKNENLLVRLLTNGTLLTSRLAEKIADIGVDTVEISLHNLDPLLHDRFTHMKGSFDAAMTAALLLKKLGVDVVFKFNLTKENFDCSGKIKEYSQTIGIPILTNAIIFPRLDGSTGPLSLCLSEVQLRDVVEKGFINTGTYECVSGIAKCIISPDGQVFPCEFIRIGMGNITSAGFDQIWNSGKFNKFRTSAIFEIDEQCKNCESFSSCQRCPGLVYLEKGKYKDKFSQACRIARIASSIT